ncbi:MAG TPA: (2Fe-2S)-binding protein [Caldisericia bacterium]|nr:(2Fe-2S)-binding protein [Caldisericia bacterium]HXK51244.1 (2Fe-2S)-binding protein [Caldisericia bacterium]
MNLKDDNTIVCRCADVTVGEIKEIIRKGYTTLDEIKRLTRAGMGQCQGKTCRNLLLQVIANELHVPVTEIELSRLRPPSVTIPLELLAKEDGNEE